MMQRRILVSQIKQDYNLSNKRKRICQTAHAHALYCSNIKAHFTTFTPIQSQSKALLHTTVSPQWSTSVFPLLPLSYADLFLWEFTSHHPFSLSGDQVLPVQCKILIANTKTYCARKHKEKNRIGFSCCTV